MANRRSLIILIGLLSLLGSVDLKSQSISWEPMKGPFRGVVLAMTLTPEGALLVSVNEAGSNHVYRSSDKGSTWTMVSPGDAYVLGFGIDTVGRRIYYGTESCTLWRSDDDGRSWIQLTPPASYVTAFVGLSNGRLLAGTYSGIFKTDDGGQHWAPVSSASGDNLIYALTMTPWGSLLIGTYLGGIFSSPDSGVTWLPIGLQGIQWTGPLACTASGIILAGSNDGLYASTDRGSSWNHISPTSNGVHAFTFDQNKRLVIGLTGWTFYTLNPAFGVLFSTDNGTTWGGSQLTKYAIVSLVPDSDGDLFAGTDGGVHLSTDGGKTWRMVGVSSFPVMALGSTSTGTLFAGDDMDGGVFYSTNQGDDWCRVAWGLDNSGIRELAVNSQDHLFTSAGENSWRTTDCGTSWEVQMCEPINQFNFNQAGYGYAASLRDASGVGGVFFSSDNGASWARMVSSNFDVFSIASNDPYVIVGTANGVYRSTDLGQTWAQSDSGLPSWNVPCVFVDTCQSHPAYGVFVLGTSDSGMFRSTNNGVSWVPFGTGLQGNSIIKIAGDVFGDVGTITDKGSFFREGIDSSWRSLPWGFSRPATAVMISPSRRIYVSPYGDKLQRSNQALTIARSEPPSNPSSFVLFQNYPNPFNPSTTIRYSLPRRSQVTLSVYNTLGQLVSTLANGEEQAGYHEVKLDGTGLASGLYFYRLQTGGYVQTKKLLILR